MECTDAKGRFVKGSTPWNKGLHHTKETIKKISESNKNKISWNKGKEYLQISGERHYLWGKHLSKEICKKISDKNKGRLVGNKNPFFNKKHTEETRKKMSEAHSDISGKNNPNWKGGITSIRYCPKFNKKLKEYIRERDNRTCQACGAKENGEKLRVHHVHYDKPNCYPDLISLCHSCHSKTNGNREYWEKYFMRILYIRGLLYLFPSWWE